MPGWSLFKSRKSSQRSPGGSSTASAPQSQHATAGSARDNVVQYTRPSRSLRRQPPFPQEFYLGRLSEPAILATVASITQAVAANPAYSAEVTRYRRATSSHAHRSLRSRSSRSIRSGRSTRNLARVKAVDPTLVATRRCYVCARQFSGKECSVCKMVYSEDCALADVDLLASPLDISLLSDLARAHDINLVEAVICRAFADVSIIIATFCSADSENQTAPFTVNRQAVSQLYDILSSIPSTAPMRAVLQGAEAALCTRPYSPLSRYDIAYITVLLDCPVFTECSMFTKITGPLQKLARYTSLRSRARMLLELCMGLLGNTSHVKFRNWFTAYLKGLEAFDFARRVEFLNSYISHRLNFHYSTRSDPSVPERGSPNADRDMIATEWYKDDWRLFSVVRVFELFYLANEDLQLIPKTAFANVIIDHVNLDSDYGHWRRWSGIREDRNYPGLVNQEPLYFSEYPFLISLMSKFQVVKRASTTIGRGQPDEVILPDRVKADEPATVVPMVLVKSLVVSLKIRRSHLLKDSLILLKVPRAQLRRHLRVEFDGEPGIDAGGLRKEWMLLLFRQLLDPELGIFVVADDQSASCWFAERKIQYVELAGVALGLALRNSLIVDVNFPTLLYKKLMVQSHTLEDCREIWPSIVRSLQAILAYEGDDFTEVFGLNFVAPSGCAIIKNGKEVVVTKDNRAAYVSAMLNYMPRNTQHVVRFTEGFFNCVDRVALKFLRVDEVELLLRGDRQPIDVTALQQVANYALWKTAWPHGPEPVLEWFWSYFAKLDPADQGLLLSFITGTDRIPATGITNLHLRFVCLGEDSARLPVAHTCFNQIGLYRYSSREKLEKKLHMAFTECQGFGIE